eukprot:12405133-Karenia_brevis.AAC.1
MGPFSNTRQWQKTYEKGDMRVSCIAGSGAAAAVAALTYNSKVTTIYAYKGALVPHVLNIR